MDENIKDANYIVYNYKTIWCPYTLEYALCHLDTTVETALMLIIFKTTAEILENISICRKSVGLGVLHTKFNLLKREAARLA
jgi:hypothetical protein